MDPEEMAVLYRYAPLFLADGQQALSDLDHEMAANSITGTSRTLTSNQRSTETKPS